MRLVLVLMLFAGACVGDVAQVPTDASTADATDSPDGAVPVDLPITPVDAQGEATVSLCSDIVCGTLAHCDDAEGKCVCDEGTYGDPLVACQTVQALEGWIGSPCLTDGECNYSGGQCLLASAGYSGGHCSMGCTKYCPDKSGLPGTYCIQPQDETDGHCFSKCDYSLYPLSLGCRPGYACTIWARIGESNMDSVCVPEDWVDKTACSDPLNLAGDDNCYFELVSFGDSKLKTLAQKIIKGTATKAEALEFLDLNHSQSQLFIKNELGVTVYNNYTAGHSSSTPMKGMIVHYTANQREDGTIKYFVGSSPHASSHFVLGSYRNGLVVQLFSHKNRTWHAGSAYNHDRFGFDFANAGYLTQNSGGTWVDYAGRAYTLYVPLHGNNPIHVPGGIPNAEAKYANREYWQPYTYYQLLSYVLIGRALHAVYNLDPAAIQRHGDVAGSRVDPGPALPTTFLNQLIFTTDDLLTVPWLSAYRTDPLWIQNHPEAR
jgi:N-acetyl-anhydromuramyl-L-alanine amidase AmpD